MINALRRPERAKSETVSFGELKKLVSTAWHACGAIVARGAVVLLLPACAMEGDFGRPRTFSLLGLPLDAAYLTSVPTEIGNLTRFGPTADEEEMHRTAYRLRVQIHNLRPVKLALASEAAYAAHLTRKDYRYGPSRVAEIDHELHADHQALTLFGAAASRVAAADRSRLQALLHNDAFLKGRDKRNARNRMRRNLAFIEGTFADLEKRIAAYDYAIDRTGIETPGVSTFAVEGSLSHLRDRATSLHYGLTQSYMLLEVGPAAYRNGPPPLTAPGRRQALPAPPADTPIDIRPPTRPFK